jgi:hypothetical protein
MKTFKKFIAEAYDVPLTTNKEIDMYKQSKIDKKFLKKLLKLLKPNKLPVPIVGGTGTHKGKISVRFKGHPSKTRNQMMKPVTKTFNTWKKQNKITSNVRLGDGSPDLGKSSGLARKGKQKIDKQGDVAEGVFAAMIFMKFADKSMTEKTLNKILYKLKLNKEIKATTTTHKKVQDIIKLSINMGPRPFADLINPEFEELRNKMFLSANAYTKSKNVEKYEKFFKSNGKLDEIRVVADGLSDQKGTKTDIYIEVKSMFNGSIVTKKYNLSLKFGSVGQFGQVSGSKFSNFVELWKTFEIDIKGIKTKYENLVKNGNVTGAIDLVYKTALKQFKADFSTKTEDMSSILKLFKAINHHATLGDNIEMVHLNKGTFESYTFKQTKAKLISLAKAHKFTAELISSKPKDGGFVLPKIKILMDGKEFLTIRSKADKREHGLFYARNYIEKKEMFGHIFSQHHTKKEK